jgi:hemolysin III
MIKTRKAEIYAFDFIHRTAGVRHISTSSPSSIHEEAANAMSHGIGAVLSIAALLRLLQQTANSGNASLMASSILYGSSLVMLYSCSTLLHSSRQPRWIYCFEMLDHAAIYLLIAGTYTPLFLALPQGWFRCSMLTIIWFLAIVGVLIKLLVPGKYMSFSLIQYIAMGLLLVPLIPQLRQVICVQGIQWLLTGLAMYSFGSVFYFWRVIRYHHMIWHVFVLAGSCCHFIAIYHYVIPFS